MLKKACKREAGEQEAGEQEAGVEEGSSSDEARKCLASQGR
jgi:hypothetical protein